MLEFKSRVTAVQNVNSWSKAGVMIRESLATNAANAFVAVTPGNGVTWQYRSSTGDNTCFNNTSGLSAPCWVKLVRRGNTFTGCRSVDGLTWAPQGTSTFTIASTVYVGLALTSHNNSNLCAATFDNLTAPNWSGPTPHIGDASIAGGSLVFSGTNGLAGGAYTIWSATNLSTSPTNWIQVGSGYFDGNGNFNISNSINTGEAARYYMLRQP